jgi:nucleoside-diphosphate-sugar epimerase
MTTSQRILVTGGAGFIGSFLCEAQTRSFCYVADMVDGLQRLVNNDNDITGPVNLGNTQN